MEQQMDFVDLSAAQTSKRKKPRKNEARVTMSANAVTLVECSNACPFVARYDNYRCFYCPEQFVDITELRIHIGREHSVPVIKPKLDNMPKGTYVMVEISDLQCKICDTATPNILDLKQHLQVVHGKHLYADMDDGLIPFRLVGEEEFNCLVCGQAYQKFQSLNTHMNVHYGDKVCEICGAGFLSKARLKSHKMIHKDREAGSHPCDECDKTFETKMKRKRHVDRIHRKLTSRYKCPRCPEDFPEYYIRISHMWNVHDIPPPEYKCQLCENTYRRPHLVTLHMRKCHGTAAAGDAEPNKVAE